MHRNLRATVFALVLVLAAASAQAFPLSSHPGAPADRSLIARVWAWVGSLLPAWENAESDPNGRPQNNTCNEDEGSSMDPNG